MSGRDGRTAAYSPYRGHEGDSVILGWRTPADSAGGMGFGQPEAVREDKPASPLELDGAGHIMTVAPTGSGKGVSCIIPTLLTYNGPVIVIDPKGENAAVTAARRREMGQDVHVIDPFNISGETASRFNPMEIVDPRYADCVDAAAMIATMITPRHDRDPYWSNRAVQVITGLILHACHDMPKTEHNLLRVRELLHLASDGDKEVLNGLRNSRNEEARLSGGSFLSTPGTTRNCILSVACDALDLFRGESMKYSLYTSSFDLNAVTRGDPMTIYLVLPPHLLQSHGPVLRLWIGALFSLICRRQRKPDMPTLFLIDEAAQLGVFDPLRVSLTLLRGYGVCTWSFWQDAAQIKRLYSDWETLVGNCAALQVFGRMGARSAKGAAELLGVESPAIFRDLAGDQMVVALNGDDPALSHRPSYLEDGLLSKLATQNPFFDEDLPDETRRLAGPSVLPEGPDGQMALFPFLPYHVEGERPRILPSRRRRRR